MVKQLKKEACKSHSCHPLTKCMPMKIRKDTGHYFEPVCMKVPSCASKKCNPLEKCVMKPIKCQLTPCLEIPTCLPNVNEASPEYQLPPALLAK
uniref:Uncharacterized protein n=1 Tax=Caenorhabditis japonica TaxID=281687 RepID=A0A8R1IMB1_CAEJA